jgi:hypothetical protein
MRKVAHRMLMTATGRLRKGELLQAHGDHFAAKRA